VAVLYAGAVGDPNSIPAAAARAFATLEAAIPPRGRKMYGYWGPLSGEVPGDEERPWLEFYRRHDEVDLLVPVTG
jgi:hypothetical protein